MPINEYPSGTSFPGVIGRTADESTPAWPAPVRAPKGAPNVLFIVLDDTGFGQLGCYGSPIATPNLDRLAERGLLYNNMHTTALCSPSRSCVITGRNHHSNGMACITEMATGYPGYNGLIPFENGFLSEMLLAHGYSTYMVGKWHLMPSSQETAAGPYERWPLGRGFERFYGFLGRRHEPVGPGSHLRQPSGRAAEECRGGLSPQRGPGRPGDPVHLRRQAGRPRQAVLSALLHRCDARPAPRAQGVGRPLHRARSTTAGTPTARRCSRARRSSGSSPSTLSSHATTPTCPRGSRSATISDGCTRG